MQVGLAAGYDSYQAYWEEAIMCLGNDEGFGMLSTSLEFEDYCNLAYDFNNIDSRKLVAPMWIIDDLFTYINPTQDPGAWKATVKHLTETVYSPISLCSHHEINGVYHAVMYFADKIVEAPLQENPHMSTYDYYLRLDTGQVVNPFSVFGGRRQRHNSNVFNLDDFLDNQYIWINTSSNMGCKPLDVRMYLYVLCKRIKTRHQYIQIKAETLHKSMAIVKSDRDTFASVSYEMQKALLVKLIVNNPYVSCNMVIV